MLIDFRRVLLAVGVIALLVAAPAGAKEKAKPKVIPQATPAAQALKIYQALRDQDYKGMFYLLAFTEKGRATLTTAEAFGIEVQRGYDMSFKSPEEKAASDALLASISDIMVGEPVITDNKAVIPTSSRITVQGNTYMFKGAAHLILDGGVWKLDLTFDENSEAAMAQRTAELLGKPEKVQ